MRATPLGMRLFKRPAASVALNNTHAYRYYRLNVTDTPDGSGVGLSELEIAATPGGANTATGRTYSASSTFSGFSAGAAFDGDYSNASAWASDFSATWPQWLKADYGAAAGNWIAANEFKITARGLASGGESNQAPRGFTFEGSDDNLGWTTLSTKAGETFTDGQTKTYAI